MNYINYKLDDYYRMASFGREYKILNKSYDNWSYDLHNQGNILSKDILEIIAKEGLIRWYIEKTLPNIDIDFPYIKRLNYLSKNIEEIDFYDWYCMYKINSIFKIKNNFFENCKLASSYKYDFIKDNFSKNKEYYSLKFGKIMIQLYNESDIIYFINQILENLENIKVYFECDTIFNTFLNNNKEILNIGVAFQRLKIVIEKMQVVNVSTNNDDLVGNPDIYKFDALCDMMQEVIFSLVKVYLSNFGIENTIPKINYDSIPIRKYDIERFQEPVEVDNIYKIRI